MSLRIGRRRKEEWSWSRRRCFRGPYYPIALWICQKSLTQKTSTSFSFSLFCCDWARPEEEEDTLPREFQGYYPHLKLFKNTFTEYSLVAWFVARVALRINIKMAKAFSKNIIIFLCFSLFLSLFLNISLVLPLFLLSPFLPQSFGVFFSQYNNFCFLFVFVL